MYKDPATDEAQDEVEDAIDKITDGINVAVLAVILKGVSKIDNISLVEAYAGIPQDMKRIERILKQGRAALDLTINKTFDTMAKNNDEWAYPYYHHRLVEQVQTDSNAVLSSILESGKKDAIERAAELIDTKVLGIARKNSDGSMSVKPIREAYKAIIAETSANVAIGITSFDGAVLDAAKMLSNSGTRVIYDSGVTRNMYSAARTNVMDGYRSTLMALREQQGKEFGADGVEVSAHMPCALDHEEYQGNQYSNKQFRSIQAGLSRQLIYGANCRHTISPIILGVSKRTYSRKEVADMNRRSREQVTFNSLSGNELSMSRYDASQYQRKVETSIRQLNTEKALLEKAGHEVPQLLNKTIKSTTSQYVALSMQIGLKTRPNRTRAYVLN